MKNFQGSRYYKQVWWLHRSFGFVNNWKRDERNQKVCPYNFTVQLIGIGFWNNPYGFTVEISLLGFTVYIYMKPIRYKGR